MNQLDVSTKFGDFNIMKGGLNINMDYEINPQLLAIFHRNQFVGDDIEEDPYQHLDFFIDLCNTFKLKNYTDDEVMLKIFNQSLTGTTLSWYRTCPVETILTWRTDTSKTYLLSRMLLLLFFPLICLF
jgi:hypothetical protein